MGEQLKVEYIGIDELKPYANNAKIHTDEQIDQIAESIRQFGFNDPIAIWKDNEIIEGHGRLIAAKQIGMQKVPVLRLDNLTDDQRIAYMIVHNSLTMDTTFDYEILDSELESIDIDMSAFGFEKLDDIDISNFIEDIEEREKKKKTVVCPHCGKEFEL